jgi:arabinofuranosyltransferase
MFAKIKKISEFFLKINLSRYLLPLAASLIFTILGIRFFHFTVTDDSFISYRYAENLSSGLGFVFNEGEKVEGFSNFLFVVLIAGFSKLGLDVIIASKILGIICGIGTIIALFSLANVISPLKRSINGIAGIILASSIPFCVWSISGMETAVYTFLIVMTLNLHLREWQKQNSFPLSALFFLFIALTRPEGTIFFGVAFLTQFIYSVNHRKKLKKLIIWSCIFLIPYLCYFFWRWNYFDSFLPNVAHAKLGGDIRRFLVGIKYIFRFLRDNEGIFLYLIGFLFAFLKNGIKYARILLALSIAAILGFIIYAGGDWMRGYRFIVPILPLAYLLCQEGAFELVNILRGQFKNRIKVGIFLMIIVCSFTLLRYTSYSQGVREISSQNKKWNQIKSVGIWMKKNLPSDSVVALGPAGMIPYYSQLRIIDMYGLMDKTIARKGKWYEDGNIFTKTYANYVLSRNPNYILLFGRFVGENDKKAIKGGTPYSIDMLEQVEFHKKYEIFWKQSYPWGEADQWILLFKMKRDEQH